MLVLLLVSIVKTFSPTHGEITAVIFEGMFCEGLGLGCVLGNFETGIVGVLCLCLTVR